VTNPTIITNSKTLIKFCDDWKLANYIAIDTEFIREKTYWPKLCLIQIAGPNQVAAIDPQAESLELEPLFKLLENPNVIKVFHSARQDIELFFHLTGKIPSPLFDTQLAAMVCGFGDSIGYDRLAESLVNTQIDKGQRFTDWSFRPLTQKQISYALDDVIYLRPIYDKLKKRLENNKRESWIEEEMNVLTDPITYNTSPTESWKRIKTRNRNPKFLAVLREISTLREQEAQRCNLPRNRIVRDEALTEIASRVPTTIEELSKVRALSSNLAKGKLGRKLLNAVKDATAIDKALYPSVPKPKNRLTRLDPLIDLLKVLLKIRCHEEGIAPRLVATTNDLESFATDETNSKLLVGWRKDVFGKSALALKNGKIGMTFSKGNTSLINLNKLNTNDN